MAELHIDPNIRFWVFLPIVIITLLIEILRYYLFKLMASQRTASILQVEGSQVISRARLLRENGIYLPQKSFAMRKAFFNDNEKGLLKASQRLTQQPSLTHILQDMLKGNFLNVIPMIIIGSWINIMFSRFVTTKVPFPLTLRFKPMLQAGIELDSLDASWVSSASWYIINIFGLRPIYSLMIGENDQIDPTHIEAENLIEVANTVASDPVAFFKAEYEALELTEYQNFLGDAENEILDLASENAK